MEDQITLGDFYCYYEYKVLITHLDCRCGFFHRGSECQKDANGNPVGERFTVIADIHPCRASYEDCGVSYAPVEDGDELTSMSDLNQAMYEADGQKFIGYGGGKFRMNSDTPVWIDDGEGSTDCHPIVGIEGNENDEGIVFILVPREYDY